MDKFVIEGGRPLVGEVEARGAKNAALPMMAAALLTREPLILRNVPDLLDVHTMARILQVLGVRVARRKDAWTLQVEREDPCTAPYELVKTMRASFCVLGPLLGRRGRARVSLPGGCVIGVRPVNLHIKGMAALGAKIDIRDGYVIAEGKPLHGGEIYLGGAYGSTVTGTSNVLMAAVLAEGTTVIESAACEPEVQELAWMLTTMGAKIEGIGSPRLLVEGVPELRGVEWSTIPDRIEAGTFLLAGALTGGDVTVHNTRADHLSAVLEAVREIGAKVERINGSIRVQAQGRPRAIEVTTLPYPGFPTDLQAQMMTLLSIADGISVVTEKVYPDRFLHVAELGRMGAKVHKEGPSAIIRGVQDLSGAPVMASDLRGSAALVLAALRAQGTSEISRVYHLDRGYERMEERLDCLGGRIRRVDDKKANVVEEPPKRRVRWAAAL